MNNDNNGDRFSGFRCNLCNLNFLTPRKLRQHQNVAHGLSTEFACYFCDALLTSEDSLVTHERMHTGTSEYACLICHFRCNRYLEMEDHKRMEH